MKYSTYFFPLIVVLCTNSMNAQDSYFRNESANVQQYVFNLSLNDSTNSIIGETGGNFLLA